MFKYYYEGKLIRTSKNHIYTHAIINTETGGCTSCHSSKELAEKAKAALVARYKDDDIELLEKAIRNGKSFFIVSVCRGHYAKIPVQGRTLEDCTRYREENRKNRERILNNFKIVEVETA